MQASFDVRAAFEVCKITISEAENQFALVQNIEVKNFLVFSQPNALQISYWYAGLKQQGKCRKQKGSKV